MGDSSLKYFLGIVIVLSLALTMANVSAISLQEEVEEEPPPIIGGNVRCDGQTKSQVEKNPAAHLTSSSIAVGGPQTAINVISSACDPETNVLSIPTCSGDVYVECLNGCNQQQTACALEPGQSCIQTGSGAELRDGSGKVLERFTHGLVDDQFIEYGCAGSTVTRKARQTFQTPEPVLDFFSAFLKAISDFFSSLIPSVAAQAAPSGFKTVVTDQVVDIRSNTLVFGRPGDNRASYGQITAGWPIFTAVTGRFDAGGRDIFAPTQTLTLTTPAPGNELFIDMNGRSGCKGRRSTGGHSQVRISAFDENGNLVETYKSPQLGGNKYLWGINTDPKYGYLPCDFELNAKFTTDKLVKTLEVHFGADIESPSGNFAPGKEAATATGISHSFDTLWATVTVDRPVFAALQVSTSCEEKWVCGSWFGDVVDGIPQNVCSSEGTQFRRCFDLNQCGTGDKKPQTEKHCDANTPVFVNEFSLGNAVLSAVCVDPLWPDQGSLLPDSLVKGGIVAQGIGSVKVVCPLPNGNFGFYHGFNQNFEHLDYTDLLNPNGRPPASVKNRGAPSQDFSTQTLVRENGAVITTIKGCHGILPGINPLDTYLTSHDASKEAGKICPIGFPKEGFQGGRWHSPVIYSIDVNPKTLLIRPGAQVEITVSAYEGDGNDYRIGLTDDLDPNTPGHKQCNYYDTSGCLDSIIVDNNERPIAPEVETVKFTGSVTPPSNIVVVVCDKSNDCDPALIVFNEAPETCFDGTKNLDETDVDCGGSCGACSDSQSCKVDLDCSSNVCQAGICVSCTDGIKNQDETGVDCGGSCSALNPAFSCPFNSVCKSNSDCNSNKCINGICEPPVPIIPSPPGCIENWVVGNFLACINGTKVRNAIDLNQCGTEVNKPILEQACTDILLQPINEGKCMVCDFGACVLWNINGQSGHFQVATENCAEMPQACNTLDPSMQERIQSSSKACTPTKMPQTVQQQLLAPNNEWTDWLKKFGFDPRLSTDFSRITDMCKVPLLLVNKFGSIQWNQNICLSKYKPQNFFPCVIIEKGFVSVDANKCPDLNAPAGVKLNNIHIPEGELELLKDGACVIDAVEVVSHDEKSGLLNFKLPGFSSYRAINRFDCPAPPGIDPTVIIVVVSIVLAAGAIGAYLYTKKAAVEYLYTKGQ